MLVAAIALAIGVLWSAPLEIETVRAHVASAGPFGALAFVGLFGVALMLSVPGVALVGLSFPMFGAASGALLSLAGAVLGMTGSFAFVRVVGGERSPIARWQRVARLLEKVERRPISIIAALRIAFQFSPPVTYALAMTRVSYPAFLLGSVLGLLPVLAVLAIAYEAWA